MPYDNRFSPLVNHALHDDSSQSSSLEGSSLLVPIDGSPFMPEPNAESTKRHSDGLECAAQRTYKSFKAPPKTASRHRKVLRDGLQGITKSDLRRLARRAGVKRMSGLIYEETRGALKLFLENTIRDAVTYTEHARRKTVTPMDILYALKRQGRTLYTFSG